VDGGQALRLTTGEVGGGQKAERDHEPVSVEREGLRLEGRVPLHDGRAHAGQYEERDEKARPEPRLLSRARNPRGDKRRDRNRRQIGERFEHAGRQDPGEEIGMHHSLLGRSISGSAGRTSNSELADSPSAGGWLSTRAAACRFFRRRAASIPSRTTPAMPREMKTSATLKVGQ